MVRTSQRPFEVIEQRFHHIAPDIVSFGVRVADRCDTAGKVAEPVAIGNAVLVGHRGLGKDRSVLGRIQRDVPIAFLETCQVPRHRSRKHFAGYATLPGLRGSRPRPTRSTRTPSWGSLKQRGLPLRSRHPQTRSVSPPWCGGGSERQGGRPGGGGARLRPDAPRGVRGAF